MGTFIPSCASAIPVLLLAAGSAGAADTARPAVTIGVWNNQLVVTAPADERGALPNAEQRMTVAWQDAGVDEAAAFLRETARLNVVCMPGCEDRRLTLSVRDMPLRHLVTWMAKQSGLHIAYQREALVFSPEPLAGGPSVMKMYDVTDLVTPIRDFPGPEMTLAASGGTSNGINIVQPEEKPAPADTEDLAAFLRRQVHAE